MHLVEMVPKTKDGQRQMSKKDLRPVRKNLENVDPLQGGRKVVVQLLWDAGDCLISMLFYRLHMGSLGCRTRLPCDS